jgi:hypothetical protein
MKYIKLFEELSTQKDIDVANRAPSYLKSEEIYKIIQRDCAPFLEELRSQKLSEDPLKNFLFRMYLIDKDIEIKNVRKDRRPRDTGIRTHNILNDLFLEYHGVKAREQGVFVTNDFKYEGDAPVNIFFPIGEYKYLYHENVHDLFPFMIASGAGTGETSGNLKNMPPSVYISERGLDITIEDLRDANNILRNLPSGDMLSQFSPVITVLKRRGLLDNIEIQKPVGHYDIRDIKKEILDWSEKTLKKFLVPLIQEYESEGIMDCPNNIEATFICDKFYLVNALNFEGLSKLIFG